MPPVAEYSLAFAEHSLAFSKCDVPFGECETIFGEQNTAFAEYKGANGNRALNIADVVLNIRAAALVEDTKTMPTVAQITAELDTIAPPHLRMDGDPHGLLVGDETANVTRIVVSLDVTQTVVDEAIRRGVSLIIAHHPLIYQPLKRVVTSDAHPGNVVISCFRAGIAVACAHTNWDIADGGINDVLAELIGLQNTRPVQITVEPQGIGRVGDLAEPITGAELLARTKAVLQFDAVRMPGDGAKIVRRVAVGGGACAFLVKDALAHGADALITSDVRHHEYIDAEARGILLLDAGHAETETPGTRRLAERLADALPGVAVHFI